jgi:hypothetical protein
MIGKLNVFGILRELPINMEEDMIIFCSKPKVRGFYKCFIIIFL